MLEKIKNKYYHYRHIFFWKVGHYKSTINRNSIIKDYLKNNKIRKLQLACGEYKLKKWLNTDLFGGKNLVSLNLNKKFPIPTNSFNYVFLEHTIEHFNINKGLKILEESRRVLKQGGKIRIATPNLSFLINIYKKNKTPVESEYLKWHFSVFPNKMDKNKAASALLINKFVRSWGHEFIYDPESLTMLLKRAGFKNIKQFKPGKSSDKHLRGIEKHWKSFNKKFNNLETFVLEAQK